MMNTSHFPWDFNVSESIPPHVGHEDHLSTTVEQNVSSSVISETEETMITNEDYQHVSNIIYTYVIPTICLCGFVGNFMAVAVLYRTARQFKQSIYIYMCALTVVDTLYMVISLVRCVTQIIKTIGKPVYNFVYKHSFVAMMLCDITVSDVSVFMLIIMSVERFVAIRSPLTVKNCLIAKKPCLFIFMACLFVVIVVAPLPFCLEMTEDFNSENNTHIHVTTKPYMVKFFDYYMHFHSALLNYAPFLIIVGLNIALPIQYSKSMKRSSINSFNNPADNQKRILSTVFVVTMTYTLLTLPQIFIETLSAVDKRFSMHGSEKNLFWLIEDVNNILTNLNMATDFIIYILMSRIYCRRFMNMFCPKRQTLRDTGLYSITGCQTM